MVDVLLRMLRNNTIIHSGEKTQCEARDFCRWFSEDFLILFTLPFLSSVCRYILRESVVCSMYDIPLMVLGRYVLSIYIIIVNNE